MKKLILLLIVISGCSKPAFKSRWIHEKSPDTFQARFETSKGTFDLQITREYSPFAVDRFYQLLKHRLLDNTLFYRVPRNYVAQFGMWDTTVLKKWTAVKLPDEKVMLPNTRGTIAFARDGKESRGTQLFINLRENTPRLDTVLAKAVRGYPPFGKVIRGMEVVDSLYSGYGDSVFRLYDLMMRNHSQFQDSFPKLDFISKAYILKTKKETK